MHPNQPFLSAALGDTYEDHVQIPEYLKLNYLHIYNI